MNDCATPPATASAVDDGILFLNEYLYENDLITEFARLQASRGRRAAMVLAGVAFLAGGAWLLVRGGAWNWLGFICILVALYLFWRCKNLRHDFARMFIDAIDKDPSPFGNRYRRVAVGPEGIMVFARTGASRYYRFEDMSRCQHNDRIIVAVFGGDGVCIPRDTFQRGTAEELERFLEEHAGHRRR